MGKKDDIKNFTLALDCLDRARRGRVIPKSTVERLWKLSYREVRFVVDEKIGAIIILRDLGKQAFEIGFRVHIHSNRFVVDRTTGEPSLGYLSISNWLSSIKIPKEVVKQEINKRPYFKKALSDIRRYLRRYKIAKQGSESYHRGYRNTFN